MNVHKHFYEDEGFNQVHYYNNQEKDNEIPLRVIHSSSENNKPSLLRRNFIYISMFLIILIAIVINNYDIAKFLNDYLEIDIYKYSILRKYEFPLILNNTIAENNSNSTHIISEEAQEDWVLLFKENYIYPYYWELLVAFLLISILFVYAFAHHLKYEQNINIKNEDEMENQIKSDPYLIRQSTHQYEQLRDYYTRRELDKLYNSDQFKQMRQEKGDNLTNWNWQMKEKATKDVYREKGTESEDISHLSLSD